MKKLIIIFLSIVVLVVILLFIAFNVTINTNNTSEAIDSEKTVADVIKLDGSKQKMNLTKQDINKFEAGDKIYSEYEDGIFQEGTVIGGTGDEVSVQGSSIINNGQEVYKDDRLSDTNNQDLFGEDKHIVGTYKGEDNTGETSTNSYDQSLEFIVSDSSGNLSVISSYIGKTDEFNIESVSLYIEDK